jgi:hypothetical protein
VCSMHTFSISFYVTPCRSQCLLLSYIIRYIRYLSYVRRLWMTLTLFLINFEPKFSLKFIRHSWWALEKDFYFFLPLSSAMSSTSDPQTYD